MRVMGLMARWTWWTGVVFVTGWSWVTAPAIDPLDWKAGAIAVTTHRLDASERSGSATLVEFTPTGESAPAAPALGRPAILLIHGGSWIGGSAAAWRSDPPELAVRLAREGMVVFAVDYRLARPGKPSWPAVVGEIREAVRWIRRHAAELGIDPSRIATVGISAGAHLAAMIGTLDEELGPDGVSARVRAVVSFYGPTDLPGLIQSRRLGHEPVLSLLGEGPSMRADVLAAASPIRHVTPDDPPFLFLHGSEDRWVPLDQSVRMASTLAMAGVPHRLIVVEGARHGFGVTVEAPVHRDLLPEIVGFLDAAWNISSVAAVPFRR